MPPTVRATAASPDATRIDPMLQLSYHNHDSAPSYHDTAESWAAASISSSTGNIESATAEWFGLLLGDAVLENSNLPDLNFESDGFDVFGNSIAHSPVQTPDENAPPGDINGPAASPFSQTSNLGLLERVPRLGGDQLFEKQAWHSSEPIELLSREHFLFRHFVQHISQWVSLIFAQKHPVVSASDAKVDRRLIFSIQRDPFQRFYHISQSVLTKIPICPVKTAYTLSDA